MKDEIFNMSRAWGKDKPVTSQTPSGRSIHCATRTHGVQGHLLGSYVARVLHSARICSVDSVLYGDK